MGAAVLDGASAWRALMRWLQVPGVRLVSDPPGVDERLGRWSRELHIVGGHWTDAYLAAFAAAGGYGLVAFDDDIRRHPGIRFLHLRA